MRQLVLDAMKAVRETLVITFVDPIREGHPRPSSWSRGLPAIAGLALVLYFLLALAAIFASEVRQSSDLVISTASGHTLPESAIWLLLCAVVTSFALIHTAALHTSWWLRVALFLLGIVVLFYVTAPAAIYQPWVLPFSSTLYLALLIFTLWRSRRVFVWWEFVVVAILVGLAMLAPLLLVEHSLDTRVVAIEGTFSSIGVLAYPALLVGGSAPAQIVVTAATAAAKRPVKLGLFVALGALSIGWLVVATVLEVTDGTFDYSLEALAASGVTLALVAGFVALWLFRSRRKTPDEPSEYPDVWGKWLYPLATAVVSVSIATVPFVLAINVPRLLGWVEVADQLNAFWNALMDNNMGLMWRAGIGVVLIGVAWRISRKGRVGEATLLSALSVATLMDAFGVVSGFSFLLERNTAAIGLIAAGIALVGGAILALRRLLDRGRATWIVTVVLLVVLYPFRDTLDDPAGAALVFSTGLVVLFGLTWRILTGSSFLQGNSRHFPSSTRVLLFIANSLFAATSVAFVALARAKATNIDSTVYGQTGDWLLGEPLYIAGLVTAVWLALRPAVSPTLPTTQFAPPMPPSR
ncbi:MAG: hypothetical protein FWG47_07630 [Propionibacteriaceae bacterium]|nr:hypothetical protein [Propionibacteriaceae bacterium]